MPCADGSEVSTDRRTAYVLCKTGRVSGQPHLDDQVEERPRDRAAVEKDGYLACARAPSASFLV